MEEWNSIISAVSICQTDGTMKNLSRCRDTKCRELYYAPLTEEMIIFQNDYQSKWKGM